MPGTRARLLAQVAVLIMALLGAGCSLPGNGGPSSGRGKLPKSPSELPASNDPHVAVIVLENRSFDQVIGSTEAPFINSLATRGALATRFFAIDHPSEPNYFALTGGSTFGIKGDCTGCHLKAKSIVDQMEGAGISWKAYMERMPKPCYKGEESGLYSASHNPFIHYDRVADDPKRCVKVQPLTTLEDDLVSRRLPTYAWITPNDCNNGHDCGLAKADSFLAGLVPYIERELGPHGFLVVTWDEGEKGLGRSETGCCGIAHGGRIATIVVGPDVTAGTSDDTPLDHYSTLRTIDEFLGLPPLRQAGATATKPLDGMFSRPPRLR